MNASMSFPHRREHRPILSGHFATALGGLAIVALFAGCSAAPQRAVVPPATSPEASPAAAGFTILQINDTYKIEGLRAGAEGGFSRVRTLRKQLEAEGRPVLVLHAGDFLFPSVMSKYLAGVPMVEGLNLLDGSEEFDERLFVTPGNHEFDQSDPQILYDRVAQSKFTWLASNISVARGTGGAGSEFEPLAARFPNVKDHVVLELGGIRVGIFSLTVDDQRRPWLEYGYDLPQRRATIGRLLDDLEREGAHGRTNGIDKRTGRAVHGDTGRGRRLRGRDEGRRTSTPRRPPGPPCAKTPAAPAATGLTSIRFRPAEPPFGPRRQSIEETQPALGQQSGQHVAGCFLIRMFKTAMFVQRFISDTE